jgi:hypothetical protein
MSFKTKKHNKKSRTFRKRRHYGGTETGFVKTLRGKTRRISSETERKKEERMKIRNPNGKNRFNRSGRTYVAQALPEIRIVVTPPKSTRKNLKSPPTWQDNGLIVDNTFGPSKEGFYAGPSSIKYGMEKAVPHGKNATVLYPTGHIYRGEFNRGVREGTGALTIKDGNITGPTYEGEWKDDKFVPFLEYKKK